MLFGTQAARSTLFSVLQAVWSDALRLSQGLGVMPVSGAELAAVACCCKKMPSSFLLPSMFLGVRFVEAATTAHDEAAGLGSLLDEAPTPEGF